MSSPGFVIQKDQILYAEGARSAIRDALRKHTCLAVARLLQDGDVLQQAAAAVVLAEMPDPVVIPAFRQYLTTGRPANAVEHVARALVNIAALGHSNEVVGVLEMALGTQQHARDYIVEALGKIGGEKAVHLLLQALDDSDFVVQAAAIRALAEARDPASVPRLASMLATGGHLASTAAWALGKIGGEAATQALLAALPGCPDRVLDAVVRALGNLRSREAVPTLLDILKRKRAREIRVAIIKALGEIGDPLAVDSLIRLLGSRSPEIRFRAASALGDVGQGAQKAVPALIQCLGDTKEPVRIAATAALARIPGIIRELALGWVTAQGDAVRRLLSEAISMRADVEECPEAMAVIRSQRIAGCEVNK